MGGREGGREGPERSRPHCHHLNNNACTLESRHSQAPTALGPSPLLPALQYWAELYCQQEAAAQQQQLESPQQHVPAQ